MEFNQAFGSLPPIPLPPSFSSSLSLSLSLHWPPPPELSQESGIKCDDLVSTMQYYGLLKYWKGKHIVLRRKVSSTHLHLTL